MSVSIYAYVALGGALGAMGRFAVGSAALHVFGTGFPYGTLIVNVVGSFLMGALVESINQYWAVSAEVRTFLAVGVLGAFTTFSTFSLDVMSLVERGSWMIAAFYIVASVILSIVALFLAMALVRGLAGA